MVKIQFFPLVMTFHDSYIGLEELIVTAFEYCIQPAITFKVYNHRSHIRTLEGC